MDAVCDEAPTYFDWWGHSVVPTDSLLPTIIQEKAMNKLEVVAKLRQVADEIESHPDVRDLHAAGAGAAPAWLKTILTLLAQILPAILPYLDPPQPPAS